LGLYLTVHFTDHIIKEIDGALEKVIYLIKGGSELFKLFWRAAPYLPPIEDTGDNKVTREPNLSNILNGGVEVFGGAIDIDIGEKVRWLDGVVSGTRYSEVVCGGYWGGHSMR